MKTEMSKSLKATLMVIGAACVLLFAGGFPRLGAPEVYRGGAMLLLGVIGALLSLWGAARLASGSLLRFLFGMLLAFFALAGVAVFLRYGAAALELAGQGGAMWAGAIGMGCTALTGVLFVCIFGYLATRLLTRRLWLAMAHFSVFLIALGAYLDFCGEVTATLVLPADGSRSASAVRTDDGTEWPLGFTVTVKDFAVSYYDTERYEIAVSRNGRWENARELKLRDGRLVLGEESWPLSSLKTAPGIDRPFLLVPGEPPRLIMKMPPPVREYRALCEVQQEHRGMSETREEMLRVNEPIERAGWLLSLMSYQPMGSSSLVIMQARRAPGRIPAMAGMLGLVLSLAFWCWGLGRRSESSEEPQTSAENGAARPAGEEKTAAAGATGVGSEGSAASEATNPESAGSEASNRESADHESAGSESAKLKSVGSGSADPESAGSESEVSESSAAAEGKGGAA